MGFYDTRISLNIQAFILRRPILKLLFHFKNKEMLLVIKKLLLKSCGRISGKYRCMWKISAFRVTIEDELFVIKIGNTTFELTIKSFGLLMFEKVLALQI